MTRNVVGLLILAVGPIGSLSAQSLAELTERFIEMTAVSGFEQAMADTLVQLLPAAQRDRAGNVVMTLGDGSPTRAVVCPMDEWGYVVGRIHSNGYVTVRRVGSGQPPYFDQAHAARRVNIWGSSGRVPAVVGVPSTHLRRRRGSAPEPLFSADDIYLDLGADSPEEVASLGVGLLNPVAMEKDAHVYGASYLSGPNAARRSACAALVSMAMDSPSTVGTVVIAFVVESRIGHRGLATFANGYGPFDKTLLLSYPLGRRIFSELGEAEHIDISTKYPNWQVETVNMDDVETLAARVSRWLESLQ